MRRSTIITTLLFAGALAMSTPALAQHGGGHGGGGGHTSGGSRSGGTSAGSAARAWGGGARMGGGVGVTRGTGGAVRGPYVGGGGAYRGGSVYRGSSAYRGGAIYGSRVYGSRYYGGGRYWNVAPIRYYHPYYSFRPYFSLGFGLWAGYPVSWAYPYYDPYYDPSAYPDPYPDPYSDPYPATGGPGYSVAPPVNVTPNTQNEAGLDQGNLGGMSFEISPSDAQIFIDGNPVGTVGQFTPSSQPLGVPAGRHHIEIRQSGYKTMSFDVDIVAGQVIPYQGQMER